MRSVEGIQELVCEPLPESNQAAIEEVERGIGNLQRAVRFNRRSAQSYYHLGKGYCLLGELGEAQKSYQQYTELRPDNPLGYIGLGFAYEALGEGENSKNAWVDADLEPHEFNAVGDEYFRVDDYDEAMLWYERALLINAESAETWLNLGKAYESVNDFKSAVNSYEKAWHVNPEIATLRLVESYKRVGDLESIESLLEQMIMEYPESSERVKWWGSLGEILSINNDWERVIFVYEEAVREYPEEIIFQVNLGWAYYESGAGLERTLDQIDRLISSNPDSGIAYYTKARILARERLFNDADEYFEVALTKNPDANWWYLERANNAIRGQKIDLAIEIYQALIERNPDFVPVYYRIAKAYKLIDQQSNAIASIESAQAIIRKPDFEHYMNSGEIFEWAGDFEKALDSYQNAFIINPDSVEALEAINRLTNK
jgi:tetratricopeptide (TPR) repeat protein